MLHPPYTVLTAKDGVVAKNAGVVLHGTCQETTEYWANDGAWLNFS